MCVSFEIPQTVTISSFHNYIIFKIHFHKNIAVAAINGLGLLKTAKKNFSRYIGQNRLGTAKNGKTVNETQPDQLRLKPDFQNCL